MKGLMLHSGARSVERGELVLVPTPEATKTWQPIPHHEILEGVQGQLERSGLRVVNEQHGLTKDGARYFGLLEVKNGHDSKDFGLMVGVRNSHDKSFPGALALGAKVFVCDNLSFSGEVKLSRKHTVNIRRDLPQLIERGVGRLADLRGHQETRFEAYKNSGMTDKDAHHLMIQCLDARVLPVTKLPELIQEWRHPRHVEFQLNSVWAMFNCVTEILKGNLELLPARTQALHGVMDAYCGLLAT